MKIFFTKRQDARTFAANRKMQGLPATTQDKGQSVNVLTGSRYAVSLKGIK
jgi:hypothetical protein